MNINTLIPDIYKLIQRKDGWFDEHLSSTLGQGIGARLLEQLGHNTRRATLRLSQLGPRCPRALWYSIHNPELAEPLPPWAEIKYSFGHILEALAITLAKASGHDVRGEQDELIFDGIVGHRDCIIDGCTVDVKSSSSIGFRKFKEGGFTDNFGYLDQLDGYVLAAREDPLVTEKNKGYLLIIDKQLGHMFLYEHGVTNERSETLRGRIEQYKRWVAQPNPPACQCATVNQGSSGNMQLDLKASYNPYKYCCNPNLRTFIYSTGPVYLTEVKRKPDVREVDKDGKIVYH